MTEKADRRKDVFKKKRVKFAQRVWRKVTRRGIREWRKGIKRKVARRGWKRTGNNEKEPTIGKVKG